MANIDKIKVNGATYNIIDTTSGYITSANDIYWCTYGTTTSAEIETAINAGKCPMVKYTNYTYTLRYRNSSTNHRFVCNYGGKEYSVVCQSSTWMPDGTLTFLTSAPVTSVNTKTGAVSLTASDVGALPSSTSIPTKTSDLTNDSGFITSAPVDSVNGQTGTVVLTASDVNALPSSTSIPTKTSDLTNDSGFITSAPVDSVNGQTGVVVLTASDVSALPDSTTIPTKTSDLTNDSGFLTSAVTTFNGQSGDITYSAPVTSVNSQTGDVTISVPTVDQTYSSSSANAQSGVAVASAISGITITKSQISDFAHTHGNITNAGDITTTVAIASGDRLVINDESASRINNSSITFGTGTTTFLSNAGTWATPSKGSITVTKLWTNSSPATRFAAQTVSLSLTSYFGIHLIYMWYTNQNHALHAFIPKGVGSAGVLTAGAGQLRKVSVTNSGVTFDAGINSGDSAIPYEIWGVKLA